MKIPGLFFVLLVLSQMVNAQCCSMGNPTGGQEQQSVLPAKHLRIYSFYKHGYNDTYFRENIRLINYGTFSHSLYDFAGLQLAYGLTHRLTLEHETGYFLQKQLRYNDPQLDALTRKGYGLSNGVLGLHYALWSHPRSATEFSVAAALKYSYQSSPLEVDGVEMPVELQPSTGALGFVARAAFVTNLSSTGLTVFLQHRFETNRPNYRNYTFGNAHHTSLGLGMPLQTWLYANLQLRNEYRSSDTTPSAARLASEGSNLLIASPALSFQLPAQFQLTLFAELPVYKYYFGEQLSYQYAFGIGFSRQFSFLNRQSL